MKSIYTAMKCERCKREFILLTGELMAANKNKRYIACPYCNSKNVNLGKETDDLRQCMRENIYVRDKGAIRQVTHNEHR
ncbi:MAG: hypothetical protein DBY38_02030 [Clostridium cadaveris]|uniref:Uncharacterized protein n=1 Tax=Clostridium cadaveris TaxID=1529 RepID=A0A316ME31_9CLOT|nr:hypothetical protein [Clostridium sp.]PWL55375.1 MAG: hypothetical protein DBY38_02030 [Clostridium cadaveris]